MKQIRKKLKKIFLLSLRFFPILIGLFFSSVSYGFGEIESFLKSLSTINVAITESRGNGHYATSILIMRRLREFGFSGQYEIYISDSEAVRTRMAFLLAGYRKKGNPEQTILSLNVRTHSFDPAHPPKHLLNSEELSFGIIGGDDVNLTAEQLNVDALLTVQPSNWNSRAPTLSLRDKEQIIFPDQKTAVLHDHDIEMVVQDPPSFIRKHFKNTSADILKKKNGLVALSKILSQNEILTAYGLSYYNGPTKLATIARAIHRLQISKSIKKPVLIPLLSNFNEHEWSVFHEKAGSLPIHVLSIKDKSFANAVNELNDGEIYIVKIGAVPQAVWNYLIMESTLPPVVAGKSGNYFCASLGRPYLNSFDYTSPKDEYNEETLKFLTENASALTNDEEKIVDFLKASRDTHSLVYQAFNTVGQRIRQAPDRLETLLEKTVGQLQDHHLIRMDLENQRSIPLEKNDMEVNRDNSIQGNEAFCNKLLSGDIEIEK